MSGSKGIVRSWDLDKNFWDLHPELAIIQVFKEIKDNKKINSSKAMWGIALVYDLDSEFYRLELKEKIKLVEEDFHKKTGYFKTNIKQEAINQYEKLQETAAIRQLVEWGRKLDEKTEFLRGIKYSANTYDMIEKMLASNTKLYAEYERLLKLLLAEDAMDGYAKGGAEESLSEKGMLDE